MAAAPYPTDFPRSGWAEQDPRDWWGAVGQAVRQVLAASGVRPDDIAAVTCDATTCTVLLLDAEGRPLDRALLWMDVRAADQARRIFQTGHPALRYSLAGANAEWMPAKLLWLKEHRPEIFSQARIAFEYLDWLTYRLTGRVTANINTASVRWYYHRPTGGFPFDFYEAVGLPEAGYLFPSEVLPVGTVVGGMSREAAEHLGLREGTPVFAGAGDAWTAMLGLDVTGPGRLAAILGSSSVFLGFSEEEFHVPGIFGTYPDALLDGLNVVEGGQVSTGSIIKWFGDHFGPPSPHGAGQTKSRYALLDAAAQDVPLGSGGLIVLDHFQGNRTPFTDSASRGAIWGLSLSTTPAHLFRAILEGVAYGAAVILRTFARQGYHVREVLACGGMTKSRLLMQIHADVLGVPLYLTEVPDATLLGTAVIAATGGGLYRSLEEAAQAMVRRTTSFEPDPSNHAAYQTYVDRYVETYTRLKDLMHQMVQVQGP